MAEITKEMIEAAAEAIVDLRYSREYADKIIEENGSIYQRAMMESSAALEAAASIKPTPSHITTWEAVDDLHTFYLNAKETKVNLRRLQMLTEVKEMIEAEWPELGPKGC